MSKSQLFALYKKLLAVKKLLPDTGDNVELKNQLFNKAIEYRNQLHRFVGREIVDYMKCNEKIINEHPELLVRDLKEILKNT